MHKAYTTYELLYSRLKLIFLIIVLAAVSNSVQAQDSFNLFGYSSTVENNKFRLKSMEILEPKYSVNNNFELSLTYGSEYLNGTSFNTLYQVSIAKSIGQNDIQVRYTPGYETKFQFNNGTSLVKNDTSLALSSTITYKEILGLSYNYSINSNFKIGTTFRYFTQKFNEEVVNAVFNLDSNSYISSNSKTINYNFWRGDLSILYSPLENLSLGLNSINLFLINENTTAPVGIDYRMKTDRAALFTLNYNPFTFLNLSGNYESTGSFSFGSSYSLSMLSGIFTMGLGYFNDTFQKPNFDGVIPSLNFSIGNLSVSAVGIFYLNKDEVASANEFNSNKISSVINNPYSGNKGLLSFNLQLGFSKEQKVKFEKVSLISDIYPTTLTPSVPFAKAKVKNISDEIVKIKPSSFINEINNSAVQSPEVTIYPGETEDVLFFTIIDETKTYTKRKIANAKFYISTNSTDVEDETTMPILVNDKNGWNGNVQLLKYFFQVEYSYSANYAKSIISAEAKNSSTDSRLKKFENIKLLFNNFAKNMTYVADPRASAEYVQFPSETIELKGGDCDDLSVCFAAQLEGVGIQTAFVDYKSEDNISHVNLLINTGIKPEDSKLITINDKKYFLRQNIRGYDEIWIPLETTALTTFENAWNSGVKKFNDEAISKLGLANGKVKIVDNN